MTDICTSSHATCGPGYLFEVGTAAPDYLFEVGTASTFCVLWNERHVLLELGRDLLSA